MSLEKKYIHNNETISGRLHDELVMMDVKKGKYFSLNPVATRIWDLLVHPMSLDELCMKLKSEYEVEEAQCHREVEEYLEEMKELGLLLLK